MPRTTARERACAVLSSSIPSAGSALRPRRHSRQGWCVSGLWGEAWRWLFTPAVWRWRPFRKRCASLLVPGPSASLCGSYPKAVRRLCGSSPACGNSLSIPNLWRCRQGRLRLGKRRQEAAQASWCPASPSCRRRPAANCRRLLRRRQRPLRRCPDQRRLGCEQRLVRGSSRPAASADDHATPSAERRSSPPR